MVWIHFRGGGGGGGAICAVVGGTAKALPSSQLEKAGSIKTVGHKRSILLKPFGEVEVSSICGCPRFAGVGVSMSVARERERRVAKAAIAAAFRGAGRCR